jgi:hypothetical protein
MSTDAISPAEGIAHDLVGIPVTEQVKFVIAPYPS